jgi:outer membrane protein OmpA-like peptidoglycan-associated protein
VAFASTTPAVCTVSGATVTLLAPGTCTVAASQDGNGTYAAAAPVSRSFQVLADGVAHDDSFKVGAATFGTPAASTLPVLANDDQGVTVQSVTQPASGSVAVRNGSVSFTPAPGFRGTVTFSYKAVDGLGFGSTGTVTVVVPDAAPVVSSSDVTTTSGRAVLVPVKGSDPNTDALATSVSAPAGATTAQVPGGVLVTPASTTSGLLKVTVRVTDPQGMTASTVATVTVRPAPAVSATRQLNGVGTTVRWTASAAAQGYQVVVGGRVVCTTTTKLTCALPQPIGPKVAVTIRVLGKDRTVSVLTAAKKIRAARPVLMTVAHFASGSATLSAGDAARIRAVAKRAAALGFDVLNVVGYTDSQGSTAYNQKLSAKRTAAVAALLHRSANTLRGVFGWAGENHPVKSNSSEQGRAANRRVEVWAQ